MNIYVLQKQSTQPFAKVEEWKSNFEYAKDFKFHYLAGDADIHNRFSECKPDVIVTIQASPEAFPNLYRLPRYLCRRWLDYDSVENVEPWCIRNCFYSVLSEQDGPEVSVFTVARGSKHISEAWRSVREQSDDASIPYREWEWVILDQSNDNLQTWNEFLVPLAKGDCRIRLYQSPNTQSPVYDAAALCRGKVVLELEQTNTLQPQAVFRVQQLHATKPNVRVLDCKQLYTKPSCVAKPCTSQHVLEQGFNGTSISIFTTCYKSGDKVKRPFESLRAQVFFDDKKTPFDDWEWCIYDDSPDDKTWREYLLPMAEQDNRVRLYRGRCNDGYIGAVKRDAASLCRGAILLELDHDDRLLPTALAKVCAAIRSHPEAGMASSDCIELYENSTRTRYYGDNFGCGYHSYYKQWLDDLGWVHIARNGALNHESLRHIVGVPNHLRAWTRTCYAAIGRHDWRLYVADDYELILRTFASKWRLIKIPELLYIQYCNQGGDNFTNHRNHYIQVLMRMAAQIHDDKIHAKFVELGMDDPLHGKPFQHSQKIAFESSTHHPSGDIYFHEDYDEIAVIMPTYGNRRELLCRAVRSLLRQTYTNWILFIIGDKDPGLDATMQEEQFLHDKRIRYFNLADNRKSGIYARNYVAHTLIGDKGRIVTYLDDDNELEPNHLASLKDALDTPLEDGRVPSFAFSSFIFEEKGELKMPIRCSEPKLYRIDTSCVMHRSELFAKYGYWRPETVCGYAVDWDIVKRWVEGNEPWRATGLFTLRYNNTKQDMEGIRDAYDDQKGVKELTDEQKKATCPNSANDSKTSLPNDALREHANQIAKQFDEPCTVLVQHAAIPDIILHETTIHETTIHIDTNEPVTAFAHDVDDLLPDEPDEVDRFLAA